MEKKFSTLVLCGWFSVILATQEYICFQTICNQGVHFCHPVNKRCELCEDYKKTCFTGLRQPNCTTFCNELREQELKGRNCPKPPDISHGSHNGSHMSTYPQGQIITYSCNEGFSKTGLESISCRDYGQWTLPPVCEETTCPVPEPPEHGTILFGSQYNGREKSFLYVNESITITCNDKYKLYGKQSSTCTSQGLLDNKIPVCIEVTEDTTTGSQVWDTGPSWIIIVCVVLAVILLVVIVRFVVKKLNNCHKTPKYNSVTGDEEQGRSHLPVDGGSLSLLDREEVQADTRTIDSGLPTPLSAHSSSSTITQTDIDGTLGFECERHISRTANEAKQQVIKNKNTVNLELNVVLSNNSDIDGNQKKQINGDSGTVNFGIEETDQSASPNTQRKAADSNMEPVQPRIKNDGTLIHYPVQNDMGEKAIGTQNGDLPSAAEQLSRQLSLHGQEEAVGKKKVMVGSGEPDIEDLECNP